VTKFGAISHSMQMGAHWSYYQNCHLHWFKHLHEYSSKAKEREAYRERSTNEYWTSFKPPQNSVLPPVAGVHHNIRGPGRADVAPASYAKWHVLWATTPSLLGAKKRPRRRRRSFTAASVDYVKLSVVEGLLTTAQMTLLRQLLAQRQT